MPKNKEQYARAKALFSRAMDLPQKEWESFVRSETTDDHKLGDEVLSLLSYHSGESSTGASKSLQGHSSQKSFPKIGAASEGSTRKFYSVSLVSKIASSRWKRVFAYCLLLLILLTIGTLFTKKVESLVMERVTSSLTGILYSNFQALHNWSEPRFQTLEQQVSDSSFRKLVTDLSELARSNTNPDILRNDPRQKELQKIIEIWMNKGGYHRYSLIDYNLTQLSEQDLKLVGTRLKLEPSQITMLDHVEKYGRGFFANRKYGMGLPEGDVEDKVSERNSLLGVRISDGVGKPVAALAMFIDTNSSILPSIQAGRWGDSGETYAFDAKGRMMTTSRFVPQLQAAGLLSEKGGEVIELKDPGKPISDFSPGTIPAPSTLPFTKIVSAAIKKIHENPNIQVSGLVQKPYRDYRGIEVIGAWLWDPALEIGLITEIDAEDGLKPVIEIRTFFLVAYGVAGLALLVSMISIFSAARSRSKARLASRLGQYQLIKKIGEGGIGAVYLANHMLLKRPTAVKVLKDEAAAPEAQRQFQLEVKASSKLTHPNTIAIYDFGKTDDGRFYYAMEYLVGITLAKLLETEPVLSSARAVFILGQIAASLREAHDSGLIHRDLKLQNIMICCLGGGNDIVKVLDFGLVKTLRADITTEVTIDKQEKLFGTPSYMAPESISSPGDIDQRADIYSLGVIAYRMMTGQMPFSGVNWSALIYDVMHTTPKSIRDLNKEVPVDLADLVMSCLAKQRDDRPQSMQEFLESLDNITLTDHWGERQADQWRKNHSHLLPQPIF